MAISERAIKKMRRRWNPSELPSGWSYHKIGKVLKRTQRRIQLEDNTLYKQPVIRRGHGGVELRDEKLGSEILTKTQYALRTDDWLMSKVQILHGAFGIVPPDLDGAVASSSYFTFSPTKDLDLNYLWYLSHTHQFHETCALSSVGVDVEKMIFRIKDWQEFEFPLPPLPEQKKIAAILSSVDEAIEATEAVIEQTRTVKKGLLQELLTRGIGHTEFKKTAIGEIPKSWRVMPIKKLLANTENPMRSGPFGSALLKNELVDQGIPVLGIDNVKREKFIDKYRRFITEEKFSELDRYQVFPNDVMITIMGTVGRSCVVPTNIKTAISSKHVWTLSFDNNLYVPYLACAQINYAQWVISHFEADSQGGTMDAIRSKTLKNTLLPVPPIKEQRQIARILESLDESIKTETTRLNILKEVKRGLLQDLLTGKVRVNTLDLPALSNATPAEAPAE